MEPIPFHPRSQIDNSDLAYKDEENDTLKTDPLDDGDLRVQDRLERIRHRNRTHARRTRLRKKAQLHALQTKIKILQEENIALKQTVEECGIASILIGLSNAVCGKECQKNYGDGRMLTNICQESKQTRERFTKLSSQSSLATKKKKSSYDDGECNIAPVKLDVKGQTALVGSGKGKSFVNWKTGFYIDKNGDWQQLNAGELDNLRRERNRIYAKMTRDRRKCFISNLEKSIEDLERDNRRMRK